LAHDVTQGILRRQVDDSNLTLAMAGETVAAVFGTTHEFYNMAMNTMAKVKFRLFHTRSTSDYFPLVQIGRRRRRSQRASCWRVDGDAPSIETLNPKFTIDRLYGYQCTSQTEPGLQQHKIREVIQYKLKRPQFSQENLKETVDKWKAEGSWPVLDNE
jgi:hypothetical protein